VAQKCFLRCGHDRQGPPAPVAERGTAVRAQLARQAGVSAPELDVPTVSAAEALGAENVRDAIGGFPEVSEVEAIRHFTRLSSWNYSIDHGMYPLGSCTMKYNPRINEAVARIEGLAWAHPYQPEALAQGSMQVMARLEAALAEITGMDAVTLQPAAGAHGELTGILLIRALLDKRGNPRRKILIPDSAHGTNPASAAIAGYAVENIPRTRRARSTWAHSRGSSPMTWPRSWSPTPIRWASSRTTSSRPPRFCIAKARCSTWTAPT